MNPFNTDLQIEELTEFGFYDDEETLRQVNEYYDEDYYDDLAAGIPFNSSNDF